MPAPQSSRFARWYYLFQHHRTDQMWLRAKKLVTSKLWSPSLSRQERNLAEEAKVRVDLAPLRALGERRAARTLTPNPSSRGRGEPTVSGMTLPSGSERLSVPEFSFLRETRRFAWPIDWRCQSVAAVSHLWRFQLHYQDALWPLAGVLGDSALTPNPSPGGKGGPEGQEAARELLWRHVADWAAAHERPTRVSLQDGWHPFCISRRAANWMQWWALCLASEHPSGPPLPRGEGLGVRATDSILHSLARQIAFLSNHLEWDLRGNHLLFNLWAIGLGAAFFDGELGKRCLDLIDAHLPEQIEEQLTEEGEHFERATAYHIEVAELFLDLREVLRPFRPRLSAQCGSIASRMTDMIVGISHPDGDPPLFGDSTFHVRPILDDLKRTLVNSLDSPSSRQPKAHLFGDYWVWRHDDDCLIFDMGSVGADELPAHAHCDLLGFEASIGGHKLFVDSGVASYDDNEVRRYCRSTAAHNCLEINGLSQCDVWGKFRMGYRGHAQHLEDHHEKGGWWVQASHDAYRRIGIPLIARHFECLDDGTWVCMDVLWGTGEHELVSRLHLHPDVKVMELTSLEVVLRVGERQVRMVFEGTDGVLSVAEGKYCPEFGEVQPTRVLEFRRKTKVPAVVKWTLSAISPQIGIPFPQVHTTGCVSP